jgi:membrane associated rhomboid family serine protease
MIPLRDDIPSRRTPAVLFSLIVACTLVFLYQVLLPEERREQLTYRFGLLPARISHVLRDRTIFVVVQESVLRTPYGPVRIEQPAVLSHSELQQLKTRIAYGEVPPGVDFRAFSLRNGALPLLVMLATTMFLHGGWMHLLGNMWYLWIFGDNVEDRLGHGRFFLLYLLAGLGGSLLHLIFNWGTAVPAIGASGAIAGVLGAYLRLYPHARILTFFPPLGIFGLWQVPAIVWLGFWFLLQFFTGTQSLASGGGGVAWWAHVGGFVAGLVLVDVLDPKSGRRAPRREPPL